MKAYRAIFFDWDGTAVKDRQAPVDEAVSAMAPLLDKGVCLLVISGTTYGNIGGGRLHERFPPAQRQNLFFGLGRGSFNYGFDQAGERIEVADPGVTEDTVLRIHDAAYGIHRRLWKDYGYHTDIVFDRPYYCKIDLMAQNARRENLYLSGNEVEQAQASLSAHGLKNGIADLLELAAEEGEAAGLALKVTCDAKYLEVGVLNKSDNVDALLKNVVFPRGIAPEDCAYWGDEFLKLADGLNGSDSFMRTKLSAPGGFFDVGTVPGDRPAWVDYLGGSISTFLAFLREQAAL